MLVPLVVLAVLSIVGGFIQLPENFGHIQLFSKLFESIFPETILSRGKSMELIFQLLSAVVSLGGVYIAYLLYYKKSPLAESFEHSAVHDFFYRGWGFDTLYDKVFVQPAVWLSEINKKDFIDSFYNGIAYFVLFYNRLFSSMQTGKIRWYVMAFSVGIIIILTIMFTL